MSIPWPTELPAPLWEGLTITPSPATVSNRSQSGRSTVRRFGRGKSELISCSLHLEHNHFQYGDQVGLFEHFWARDLNFGLNYIDASWLGDYLGYTDHYFRIVGYKKSQYLWGSHAVYSLTLAICKKSLAPGNNSEWPSVGPGSGGTPASSYALMVGTFPDGEAVRVSDDFGVTWPTGSWSPGLYGTACAMSSTGKAIVVLGPGFCGLSSDFGATFTLASTGSQGWQDCSITANGHAIMCGDAGVFAYSANNGTDWTYGDTGTHYWKSCVVLSDGHAIMCGSGGYYAYSSDFGATWTVGDTGAHGWKGCVMIADGHAIMVDEYYAAVAYSSDFGHTWGFVGTAYSNWYSCSLTTDGHAIMCGGDGYTAYSTDFGHTWTLSQQGADAWFGCSMSNDGHAIMCGNYAQYAYSIDYGITWTTVYAYSEWVYYDCCLAIG